MAGEMQRLFRRQPFVVRRNSLRRFGNAAVVTRFSVRNSVELRDPLRDLFVDRCSPQPRQDCHTVQDGKTRHFVRKGSRIHQSDHPAHRMTDNCCFLHCRGTHQTCQVIHVIRQTVAAAFRPTGVSMATEIGGHNMKVRLQCSSDPIPAAAMVAASMDEDQRRRCAITPIGIMQPQALGFVEAVCRTDQWRNHFIFGHLTPVRLAETGQLYCPHNSCKTCNFTMTKSSQDEVFDIQTGSMSTTSIDLFLFASSLVTTSPVGALGVRAAQSVRPKPAGSSGHDGNLIL